MSKNTDNKEYYSPSIKINMGDGYIKETGESSIYAVVYINRKRVKFNTGVSVDPTFFDSFSGQIMNTHPRYSDFNLLINDVRSRLTEIFIRYRLQHAPLSPGRLRKEFKNRNTSLDFYKFLESTIQERIPELSYSSIKQHNVLLSKLREYRPALTFAEIDQEFLMKFNRWMISVKKNSVNTRYNNFKNLKVYLNIARRQGIITINPMDSYSPVRKVQPERYFLTEDQVRGLKALYEKQVLSANDQRILRHFLFMCFTGLRISDLLAIHMEDVVKDMLVFTAYKTRERKPAATKIPLCRFAMQLIKDECPNRLYGPVFNCFAEQTMRRRIKEIVKVAGIHMDLSLHAGRHTFATLFLKKTKNIAALQKLLGHTKIEQTMVYAHILTEDIENEMQKAFSHF